MITFITLLVALFIERILWDGSAYRQHRWFLTYQENIAEAKWLTWLIEKPWGPLIVLFPLLLATAMLQFKLFAELGELFSMLFGLLVLLFTLGPRDLGRDAEDYLKAKATNQTDQAHQIAQRFCQTGEADQPDDIRVSQGIFVDANHRLVGPITGFLLFGAFGAVLYRLSHQCVYANNAVNLPVSFVYHSKQIFHWIDWLPASITAAGYAIAGNFNAVIGAWKGYAGNPVKVTHHENDTLLYKMGKAALAENRHDHQEDRIESHLDLAWRSLAIWLAIVGLVSISSAF